MGEIDPHVFVPSRTDATKVLRPNPHPQQRACSTYRPITRSLKLEKRLDTEHHDLYPACVPSLKLVNSLSTYQRSANMLLPLWRTGARSRLEPVALCLLAPLARACSWGLLGAPCGLLLNDSSEPPSKRHGRRRHPHFTPRDGTREQERSQTKGTIESSFDCSKALAYEHCRGEERVYCGGSRTRCAPYCYTVQATRPTHPISRVAFNLASVCTLTHFGIQ